MFRPLLAVILILSLFILFTLSCATSKSPPANQISPGLTTEQSVSTPAKAMWEEEWDRTLNTARKEGVVNIYSSHPSNIKEALSRLFFRRYNLPVNWTMGPGTQLAPKILTERKAGLFLADIELTGSTTLITVLKPQGILDILDPELLLPEVTDPFMWLENRLPWIDKDHYIIASGRSPASSMVINTTLAKKDEIKSLMDLLDPKWKGKIVFQDPTRPGVSNMWVLVMGSQIMNWDFIRQLANQDLIIVGDSRQAIEWVAQGKYPINLAPSSGIVDFFVDAGAPLEIILPKEGVHESAGDSSMVLFKNRPHPNTARVFINWYLSREGQQVLADNYLQAGTRQDISTAKIPEVKLRKPGVKYFNTETEEFQLGKLKYDGIIQETFGPIARR